MDANYFANLIASAPIQTTSRYFEAGVYAVKIDAAKIFLNRQRRPRAAVDCTVLHSNNASFPTTSQVSWIVSLDSDSGPSTLKGFIADITGCSEAEASSIDVINAFFPNTEANPAAAPSKAVGLQAIVNAFEKPTKSGGIYTKCTWRHFNPETDEMPDFSKMSPAVVAETPAATAQADNSWGGSSNNGGNWGGQQAPSNGNMPF